MSHARQAEKVVTRHGVNAWLITIGSGIMAFLMLYTLTLGATAAAAANRWETALTSAATVRITASADDLGAIAPVVEEVLATTPGIASWNEIDTDTQIALLAPWLGDELPEGVLNLPRLYSVELDLENFNEQALTERLKAEAPAAIWDNHNRWQGPLLDSARQLRFISLVSASLIGIIFIGLILITSEATIAANARSIALLRQIGGSDKWIQSGFTRRFATRALIGAVIGVLIGGALVNYFFASAAGAKGFDITIDFTFLILSSLCILAGALLITWLSTLWATRRYLKRIQ